REHRGDVAGVLVDRVAPGPQAELALAREAIAERRGELGGQPLLARAEAFAVARERRVRCAVRDGGGAARQQHEAGLVAVIAVHRAVPAAGAGPQRIGRLGGPARATEADLVEAIHLRLRDVGLAPARSRHRTRVAAHLRAERAV